MPVYAFDHFKGVAWSLSFKLKKIIVKEKIDILHVHSYSLLFYAALTKKIFNRVGIPIVFTSHGEQQDNRIHAKIIDSLTIRSASQVIAVSEALRKYLLREFNLNGKRVKVIRNGVAIVNHDTQSIRRNIRNELGIGNTVPVMICVASFQPLKDHETLLSGFKLVLNKLPDAHLLLLGEGKLKEDMQGFAKDIGIEKNIHFVGLKRNVSEWLIASDLFVLTSKTEGTSISILEAMASSKPVIATNAGGNSKIIHDGVNGFLIDVNSPDQLADRALKILTNVKKCSLMGENARNRISGEFNLESMVNSYEKIYREFGH
ncbi:MAG: glycosyltransferase family 4 protein [Thermodesulfovibrionia bacterium]|nr:glycosyltransferase family 4 protein [Thermodesulfovibrionia bacterium]